jgi:FkbM family methyltransferase
MDQLVEIVETDQGPMLLLKTDTVISKAIRESGDYAREEKALLADYIAAGDTVVDVGANIGSHTLFFARRVGGDGRVISFEAQRFLFQVLCGNVAINSLRNVWSIPAALGRKQGRVDVPVPDYGRNNNYGGFSLDFPTFKESGYMLRLDDLPLENCQLIKIDVEGMELDVLQGSRKTIRLFRPVLYLENNRPDRSKPLLDFISAELDYQAFRHGQNILCLHSAIEDLPDSAAGLSRLA